MSTAQLPAVVTAPLSLGITRIEASAGTGKTFTLAALFLRLIAEEAIDVSSILVTTYTEAATAELRDRIRKQLHRALDMLDRGPLDDPLLAAFYPNYSQNADEVRTRLERALRNFDEAAIYTIHGFCQRLLQERAFESRVLFDAELMADAHPLLREVADDFWRKHLQSAPPRIAAMALTGRLDAKMFARLLQTFVNRPTQRLLPEWTPNMLADAEQKISEAFGAAADCLKSRETQIRKWFNESNRWAKKKLSKPDEMNPQLDAVMRCIVASDSPLTDYETLSTFARTNIEKQTLDGAKTPEEPFFDCCEWVLVAREQWITALRLKFLHWAPAEFARRKVQLQALTFDDLLTRLRDALDGPTGEMLVKAARGRFQAALIDEFQDTDPVQAEIFERLFGGHGRLYFIGDPKQAIYGFRGADVFTYLTASRRAEYDYTLESNQRSVSPLVAAVNAIFSRGPHPFVIEDIRFQPVQAAGRCDSEPIHTDTPAPPFHFWLWNADNVSRERAVQVLPDLVAREIISQLQRGDTLAGRALEPSDFAVLTPENKDARIVQQTLSAAGLPAVVLSDASVLRSVEANEMLALLHACAFPRRDDFLRAALATVALGLDATGIAALESNSHAWERWLAHFHDHHARWLVDGFFPMFRQFMIQHGVRARLLSLPDGERRLTNLLHLAELIHLAAVQQRLGPAALVQWFATQIHPDTRTRDEHELRLESDATAVKIVTIHKSKGLEFNIVWCPFSWSGANLRPHEDPSFHDDANHLTLDLGSDRLDEHMLLAERERLAEHTRLFYVALTRAKHQCHLVWGRFNRCENSAANWVLASPPGADPRNAVEELRNRPVSLANVQATTAALQSSTPNAFTIHAINDAAPAFPHYRSTAIAPPSSGARMFRGHIARDWAIASFTSFTAAFDEDTSHLVIPIDPPKGIHAFPSGMRPGKCLHEILAQIDFTDEASFESIVTKRLTMFGFNTPEYVEAVTDCIRRVASIPLDAGLTLNRIPRAARLSELEFHFPLAHLDAGKLARLLGEELPFTAFSGFLKGFIDLTFEHDGRYYIADWKSNWLGGDVEAYTREAMTDEIARRHYRLQWHIYTVALHRHLTTRLPGYDYERHFGGVFYVFIRGLEAGRPELGIFRERPSREAITAWSRCFAGL